MCVVSLAVGLGLVAAALAGCGGSGPTASARSLQAYLDRALQVMEQHSLYAPVGGWPAVDRKAREMAARAKTARGTYPAIRYVIEQIRSGGDGHAVLFTPTESKRYAPESPLREVPSPPPTVALLGGGRLGVITLPDLGSMPSSANSRRYSLVALTGIKRLVAEHHPCGWIVDLRQDGGGDMFPMLFAVGPIVGQGNLIGFSGKQKLLFYTYRRGVLSTPSGRLKAPIVVPDLVPAPPVAVVTMPQTVSSGEAVALAFRGRAQTRSFGQATGGYTASPDRYILADGAEIRLAAYYMVDRNHVVYEHALQPDVYVPLFGSPGDPQLRAAAAWLLTRPACTRQHD